MSPVTGVLPSNTGVVVPVHDAFVVNMLPLVGPPDEEALALIVSVPLVPIPPPPESIERITAPEIAAVEKLIPTASAIDGLL
jgi:hypothetical protein